VIDRRGSRAKPRGRRLARTRAAAGVVSVTIGLGLLAACDKTNPDDFKEPVDSSPCDVDFTVPQGFIESGKCEAYKSCAFRCSGCSEPERPFECPAMRAWSGVAHAPSCGSFDGATMPTPVPGRCTATAPAGDAILGAGPVADRAPRIVLPDGHFIQPAGIEQVLAAPGVVSGFPLNVILATGTRFAIVSDSGVVDNAIYVVDLDELSDGVPSVVAHIAFPSPAQLELGLAYVTPNRVYASGGADGTVYAFDLDTTSGAIARVPAADIALGPSGAAGTKTGKWYVGSLATTADGKGLVIAPATGESDLRIANPIGAAPRALDLGGPRELFEIVRDSFDTSGATYWVSALDTRSLLRLNVSSNTVEARIPTGKNPEGVVVLGSTHVAVASSDDDVVQVFETASGKLVQTLRLGQELTGVQPGAMAYDATRKRVYVTLSGVNAVAVLDFDPTFASGPLIPAGRVPTAWWPTAVRVRDDGSLVVLTGKGHGTGPATTQYGVGDGATTELTHGSIAVVRFPSGADLEAMTATVDASRRTTPAEGYPSVACPPDVPYDFPIPSTNAGPPSTRIEHVVYVVRENKTFDAVFGDLPGVNGDPAIVMTPGRMDEYWANARSIAKTFANFDGYYTDAEQSLQGHVWTAFGRSTDWIERTWTATWGRGTRQPKAGLDKAYGSPSEGSLFAWAERNGVTYDDMGEIVGVAENGFDPRFPGLIYTVATPDVDKACYIAARARATCDLKSLTYVVLPNDHTMGLTPNAPKPELMIAINDEATGLLLDAISHSPMWPSTLVIVTEDDPQNGGDHVDVHRTPLFMASPWVKRGYVSSTHSDTASLHKLFAHVFAKPYPSQIVADAAIPFDAFTSTPDYTPYEHKLHTTPTTCNPPPGMGDAKQESRSADWDFSDPDDQPGLTQQVDQYMRSLEKK
jgi:DNA-binding beta-propeller fold protein YncE